MKLGKIKKATFKWHGSQSKLALLFLFSIVSSVISATEFEQCEVAAPLASWDFNAGESPQNGNSVVQWDDDHHNIQPVPDTDLQGVKFFFAGGGPNKDATSEWRYEIKKPVQNTWEYLKFYQPINFYHRAITKITAPELLDETKWNKGDAIENDKGVTAKVHSVEGDILYIVDFYERFSKNWGSERLIQNKTTGANFVAVSSRFLTYNNKLSAQWQGRYANAGMILETQAITPHHDGTMGVGYCRPTIIGTDWHKSTTARNTFFNREESACFDPADNGKVVEFVIERKRSTSATAQDGGYKIWKKVDNGAWKLIHLNTSEKSYQQGQNYFDHGYVLGWSNSGFDEDMRFFLLGWQLWDQKPDFLP
ncbi:hypothetical protein [Alteromonas ponticola]|uniref:Uncharacterized protein n=1 Tax=Alteromonas ponticola TaxID=2720613 RepID=A0ABX1QXU6_9ALTE|nr:hypothetical protein [Alteromonas ponticola]NMH59045.1 hypothetical protein [Alteromonas ponticola]